MRFDTSQNMRLSQQMKLAPRMIQSMEILQMPAMALQERIEQELEQNAALEEIEPSGDRSDDEREDDRLEERELVVGEEGKDGEDWERLSSLESTYKEAFDNEYSSSRYRDTGERDRKMDAMANVAARGESLTEQLLSQWRFAEVKPEVARLGEVIIGYVDADGLLSVDLETILEQNRDVPGLDLTLEGLEDAIDAAQHWLDPPGIAARNQRECVLLQVDALESEDELEHDWDAVRLLITEHFDDLLHNRLPKITQDTELSMTQIHDAMALMKRIKLRPGRELVDEVPPPITPDVLIEYDEAADIYIARLNGDVLPPLRVSPHYRQMVKERKESKETREFVSKNVQNAQWLIDSIRQRQNTLLRVVDVVLARQRDYFDRGPRFLRPLPMVDVADQLGVHVATVSRAVAEKWLQTPSGLVPLRRFFSGGRTDESGRDMSWEAVKETLREIIDAEDKIKPLSDELLAAEMKTRGIDIARRTVVKYRQQLDIPAARLRRVYTDEAG